MYMDLKELLNKLNIPTEIRKLTPFDLVLVFIFLILSFSREGSSDEKLIALVVAFIYVIALVVIKNYPNLSACFVNVIYIFIILFLIASHTRYFGYFSDENIANRNKLTFNKYMSNALYDYSLKNYDKSIHEFKKAIKMSTKNDIFECECWLLENYSRNNNIDSMNELWSKLYKVTNDNSYNNRIINRILPISELINYYNYEDWQKLLNTAMKYEYMNDQCISLFKIIALLKLDIENINSEMFYNEILNLRDYTVDYKDLYKIEKHLLKSIAYILSENKSPYSIVFYAELLKRGKSEFFTECFFMLPEYNNMANIRWVSADMYEYICNICSDSYEELDERILSLYYDDIHKLSMFLGIVKIFENDCRVSSELEKIIGEDEFLYNFIKIDENKYFFLKLKYDMDGENKVFSLAMPYFVEINSGHIIQKDVNLFRDGYILYFCKLFVVDYVNEKLFTQIIDGTGEYLYLNVVDLINNNCKSLLDDSIENYHVSDMHFNSFDTITYTTEMDNAYFSNSEKKVSGNVTIVIDWDNLTTDCLIGYSDPALDLFINNKEINFITPIVHSENNYINKFIIDRIKSNDEAILYSKIQESYENFMGIANCKYSGLHLLYSDGKEQAHYFIYVKRENLEVFVIDFFEVIDNKLVSLLK